jgi:hypothetical protein
VGVLASLRTILPLALSAGINLYLTVLVIGLSIRFGWVSGYPPGLEILASLPLLVAAGVMYLIEFVADKVPFVDTLWDLLHTVIRPAGAILLATSSLSAIDSELVGAAAALVGVNPGVQLFGALLACVVALISHGSKAGTRTAVNVSGGGLTLAGVAISLAEDLAVALIVFLALRFPLAANIVAGVILAAMVVVVPQLLRWAWFSLRAIGARLRGVFSPLRRPEPLPPEHAALLAAPPTLAAHCQAQGSGPIRGRYGYLALAGERLAFTYRRRFRERLWSLPLAELRHVSLRRGLLLLVLEVTFSGAAGMGAVRFAFTADRAPLAEQFVEALANDRSPSPGCAPAAN